MAFTMSKNYDKQHDRVTPAGPRSLLSSRSRDLLAVSPSDMQHHSLGPASLSTRVGTYANSSSRAQSTQESKKSGSSRDMASRRLPSHDLSFVASSVPNSVLLTLDTSGFDSSLSVFPSGSSPVPSPISSSHTIQPDAGLTIDASYIARDLSLQQISPSDDLVATSTGRPGSRSHPHPHMQSLALPAARAGSGTGSRKSSGTSSDRDAGAHLDLKRLLSKPAVHTTSSSSVISLQSDSEISGTSRGPRQGRAYPMARLRSQEPSKERLPVGGGPSGSRSSSSHPSDSHETSSSPRDADGNRRPARNVLRRKPSGRSSAAPAPAPTPAAADTPGSSSLVHVPSRHRLKSSEGLRSSSQRPTTAPMYSTSTRLKSTPTLTGLTPAGAVAHAYKQQEQRRGELEEFTTAEPQPARAKAHLNLDTSPSRLQTSPKASPKTSPSPAKEEEEGGGPYYTVFGSSTDLIAARNMDERSWFVDRYVAGEERTRKKSATMPRQSLSRKMSGRLKNMVKREPDLLPAVEQKVEPRGRDSWRPYDGSRQPKRHSESKEKPRSPRTLAPMRPSADGFVDVVEQAGHSRRSIPSARNGLPQTLEEEWGMRRIQAVKGEKGKGKEKETEEDSLTSGKWWKLVKRISTGGLRDKYRQPRASTPPPVPAIPADFQNMTSPRMTLEIAKVPSRAEVDESGVLLSRFMQSRSSMSGVRPSSHKKHHTPSRPSTGKGSSASAPRPSTTTRSSSPVSSDIASSGFFHKTHSTRSSASSYGEELPPMPTPSKRALGHYIMSPSELVRLHADQEPASPTQSKQPRKPIRSNSAPVEERRDHSSAEESRPSLPAPPRRSARQQHESPSPTIPLFSTEHAVNNFPISSIPLAEFGNEEAPPRPKRSDSRKPLNIEVHSPSLSVHTPRSGTPRTPRPSSSNRTSSTDARSLASTARQPSISLPAPTPSGQRSPLTFREIESPRQAWTEQEKADKWEALLERSNRAGGTIHIGEPGLLSEAERMSQYSAA